MQLCITALYICSVLLPDRFGSQNPYTFGTHQHLLWDSPESPPLSVSLRILKGSKGVRFIHYTPISVICQ